MEYQPKKVQKGYSIFQMTVSGIFPFPDSGTAEKLFHMGVIPYEIIPHEELYCTFSGLQNDFRDRHISDDLASFSSRERIIGVEGLQLGLIETASEIADPFIIRRCAPQS
jgi:hypothetical protein